MRSGDQNWASVSRFMKPFTEPDKPADWFSQKNCALQYTDMMDNPDFPKRKRSTDKADGDSSEMLVVKKLTHERVDELKKQIKSDQLRYKTLRREIDQLKAGQLDEEVRAMWNEMKMKDQEALKDTVTPEPTVTDNTRPLYPQNLQIRSGVKKPLPKLKIAQELESSSINVTVTSAGQVQQTAATVLSDLLQKSQELITSPKDSEAMDIDVVSTAPQLPVISSVPIPLEQDHPVSTNDTSSKESSNEENTQINAEPSSAMVKPKEGLPLPQVQDKRTVDENISVKKREEKLETSKEKKVEKLPSENKKDDKVESKKDEEKIDVRKKPQEKISEKKDKTESIKERKSDAKTEPKKDRFGKKEPKVDEKVSSKVPSVRPSVPEKSHMTGEGTDEKCISKDPQISETSKQDELKQNKKAAVKKLGNRKSGRGKQKSSDTQEDSSSIEKRGPSSPDDDKNEEKCDASEIEEMDTRRSESDRDDLSVRGSAFFESMPNSPASITPSDDQDHSYRAWRKAIMLVWRAAASHKCANVFLNPVTDEIAPGYSSVVFRPMDLYTIKKHIESGEIRSTPEFQRDMMLMFNNAVMYNSSDHNVYLMAKNMQNDVMRHIEDFIATQIMVPQTESGKVLRARETSSRRDASDKNQSDGEHHTKKRRVRSDNE
ncbi:uncharacterized protein [Antedon mediterranea]|uniref:uncharacterized protein n=1 Tax=Antedon mediterranea TaxID=105859 RepID=UPI003AF6DABB